MNPRKHKNSLVFCIWRNTVLQACRHRRHFDALPAAVKECILSAIFLGMVDADGAITIIDFFEDAMAAGEHELPLDEPADEPMIG